MGLRTKSIKTRKKLSIFSKELTFVVVKTTFVFEKEEKEEEVLQKKMKSTTKSEAQAFFPVLMDWFLSPILKKGHFFESFGKLQVHRARQP